MKSLFLLNILFDEYRQIYDHYPYNNRWFYIYLHNADQLRLLWIAQ